MCGRFTQRLAWRDLVALMRLEGPPRPLRPRYNLAPGQDAAVLRLEHGEPRLAMLRWGLVPGWTRDPAIGSRLINARAETAAEKPAFRGAWTARRCLVPADGFYEWRRGEPWLFAPRDGAVMALAGLWERWRAPAGLDPDEPGPELETFTILTTEANATVRPVHHRMPVILAPDMIEPWLAGAAALTPPFVTGAAHGAAALTPPFATGAASGAAAPLGPAPDDLLAACRVGPRVNDPRHDDPACVSPVRETEPLLPFPEGG